MSQPEQRPTWGRRSESDIERVRSFLTQEEMGCLLGVSRSTVLRMERDGPTRLQRLAVLGLCVAAGRVEKAGIMEKGLSWDPESRRLLKQL